MAEMTSKRLVIIFWNLGVGGVQTRMVDVVKKVVADGGEVLVLLDKRVKNEIKLPESKAVRVVFFSDVMPKIPVFRRPFRRIGGMWCRIKNLVWGDGFVPWLVKQIWFFDPNVVLAVSNRFSAFAVITKLLFKLRRRDFRLVINECVVASKYLDQYESGVWKKIVAWTYPGADKIIVATEAVKRDLVVNFGVAPRSVEVIRSWLPMGKNKHLGRVKKYDGIYVGRLSEEKGIGDLVMLAEEIKKKQKKYRLAVVGEGVMRDWLVEQIKIKNVSRIIDYLGYRDRDEVLSLMAKSKWLLLPSRNEGLPMVVLEAYSVGVPVVVKPFAGVEEVVDGKMGVISKMDAVDFVRLAMVMFDKKYSEKNRQEIIIKAKERYSSKNLDKFVKVLWG